jgi:alpha-tubulin suppressor-like RCC1 family protein
VTKSIKKQKQVAVFKKKEKEDVKRFIENLIVELTYTAVDLAEGHGGRLVLAKSLEGVVSKRCALRKLQRHAVRRRTMRHRRKLGQLSSVPITLASADGVIRPIKDMVTLDKSGRMPPMGAAGQLAVPSASGDLAAQTQMSLSPNESVIAPHDGTNSSSGARSPLRLPNSITLSDTVDVEPDSPDSSPAQRRRRSSDGRLRGIWHMAQMDNTGSPVATTVLAFGDCKCGQTGLSEEDVRKRGNASVLVVEDLRGCYPAQIEAAGGASFVVNGQGKVYAFGSNRSMELGQRKDVVQLTTPQLMKSMRQYNIVQVASTSSSSGQAHSLALTNDGQVLTFGTSARGALGQGPEVRQTAPLLMRVTIETRILFVAAAARHSLMLADTGRVFSFGDNSHGQLGTDQLDDKKKPLKYATTPVVVGGALDGLSVVRLAVGDDHNLAATADNKVYAWGANSNGQLGVGRMDDQLRPVLVEEFVRHGIKDITGLACGARHSLVAANRGTNLWVFGSNVQGQLGTGQNNNEFGYQLPVPKLCRTLSNVRDMRIVQVVAASSHSLALTQVGEVYAWGDNSWGQLGFPREGSTDYNAAHASRRQAPAAFGATNSAFAMTQHVRGRQASEIDAPLAFSEGVAKLSVPTRVVGLSLHHVRAIATADTHTLALAS